MYSLTDTKHQDIAFCYGVSFERQLNLADPVEREETTPSAPIGKFGQMALGGMCDSRFEHADNRMS
jgi:hypothetical protein